MYKDAQRCFILKKCFTELHEAGKTNRRGRPSTVDLLIKVPYFVTKVNNISNLKIVKLH